MLAVLWFAGFLKASMYLRSVKFSLIAGISLFTSVATTVLAANLTGPAPVIAPNTALTQAPQTLPDTIEQRLMACTACHGKQGRASSDGYYPRIAGKPELYLFNQLKNFRDAKRNYPLMTYMLGTMSDAYLQEVARYFSEQHPPYAAPQTAAVAGSNSERGRQLVQQGDTTRQLPACIACHGEQMKGDGAAIPGLLGLPRDYIVAQLGAWQTSKRHAAEPDCMAQIAAKLKAQDIADISAWLAVQNVSRQIVTAGNSNEKPAQVQKTAGKYPLQCGSVPQ